MLAIRTLRAHVLAAVVLAAAAPLAAQDGYRTPPDPISSIVTASPPPAVMVSRDRQTLAMITRDGLPALADIAEPELRLAGTRINPLTNGPSSARSAYASAIHFQSLSSGARTPVQLPAGIRIANTTWSPDGRHLAFVHAAPNGLELWVAEVATGRARPCWDRS